MSNSNSSNSKRSKSAFEQEMQLLTRGIEQFRIDTLRFLAGDLHLPPEELKNDLARRFRRLRADGTKGVAENFRLGSLEARYNSQVDLYNRRMREREQGSAKPVAKPAAPDPREGVTVGKNGDSNAVEALYKGLYLRSGSQNPGMDLEKFRSYIERQAEVVRSKTGADSIQFRIAEEGGKMKIKAKPLK